MFSSYFVFFVADVAIGVSIGVSIDVDDNVDDDVDDNVDDDVAISYQIRIIFVFVFGNCIRRSTPPPCNCFSDCNY